jgi:hypothetical protein
MTIEGASINSEVLNDVLFFQYIYHFSILNHASFRVENGQTAMEKMRSGLTVPVYVARTREPLRLSRGDLDPRFPDRLPNKVNIT